MTTTINAVAWSPDGNYLAVGGYPAADGNDLRIYAFDSCECNNGMSQVAAAAYGSPILSIAWSPDCGWLAIGTLNTTMEPENVVGVYQFNMVSQKLVLIDSLNPVVRCGGLVPFEMGTYPMSISAVAWSNDGNFLAIGGAVYGFPTPEIYVFTWDYNTQTMICSDATDFGSDVNTLAWSYDDQYLFAAGQRLISSSI